MVSRRDPDEDDRLVERSRAGDRSAFDEIVRVHGPAIRGFVRRYTRTDHDAEDVTQSTFLRAFQKIASFRGESTLRTWLHRVAINVAINYARGTPQVEPESLDDLALFTNSLGTDKLVAAELWRKVSARLGDLTAHQRAILELRLFHDLSFAEVAAVVGCSEASARVTYHHAVDKLRAILPARR